MTFFGVDDGASFHRKIVAAGNAAVGLWARAGSWCARYLTDGFVPTDVARSLGTAAQAKRLVEVKLWEQCRGGYQFHDWQQCNPTATQVAELRVKRAAAGSQGGKARAQRRASVGPDQGDLFAPDDGLDRNFSRSVDEKFFKDHEDAQAADEWHGGGPRESQISEPAGQRAAGSSKSQASAKQVSSNRSSKIQANSSTEPDPLTEQETTSLVQDADASDVIMVEPEVTADEVVARWVDANRENGIEPSQAQRSQVGRTARELLRTNDPRRVLAAARQAGRKGYASIDRELTAMHGQVVTSRLNGAKPSHTDARVAAGLSLVEQLAREEAADAAVVEQTRKGIAQ
jgi:hypothetical protein